MLPRITDVILEKSGSGLNGALVWHLATPGLPDSEGNVLYIPDKGQSMTPDLALIVDAAKRVNAASR